MGSSRASADVSPAVVRFDPPLEQAAAIEAPATRRTTKSRMRLVCRDAIVTAAA
jgi:hypothetical protein